MPVSDDDKPQRRLSDTIVKAFHQACLHGNLVAANYMIKALESVFTFEAQNHPEDRRAFIDTLTALRMELLLTVEHDEPLRDPHR